MNIIDITPIPEREKRKLRLAAYARVSSSSDEQEHSYAAQILHFTNYVKEHPEYELVDIYADEGITGTEMEKRDELKRLLSDCSMGKIDRVICKSISRFARNTEELLHMIRALKNLGVSIYFEDKDIDSDKLNMEMIITFPGMAAQQESEAISGNMRWSYRKRMEQGEFVCTCPAYGYDLIDGEMVINQAEAAIIRRTFDLYMKGHGFQAIAKLYNDEKIPRRYGKTFWHAHTIRYILTNEKYIGDSLTQKNYSTDTLPYRRLPNNGKYPKYYVKHNHEEIIDRDTFNAVQKLIAERNNEPAGKGKFPLSGKLRCAECGSTFRRQQLGDTAYWICMKKASGNSRCKSRRVKEDAVYDTFTKLLYKLKAYRTVLIEPLIETLQDMDYTDSQKDIRSIDKSIADYSAKQTVLSKLYSSGALGTDEWNIKKSEVEFELNKLRKARKKLISIQKQESINAISTLNETLREYSLSSKFDEELFSELIDKIIVQSNSQMTFCLYGGLEFTEEIDQSERCQVHEENTGIALRL